MGKVVLYKSYIDAQAGEWIRDHGRPDIDYEYQKECYLNGYVQGVKEAFFDLEVIVEE